MPQFNHRSYVVIDRTPVQMTESACVSNVALRRLTPKDILPFQNWISKAGCCQSGWEWHPKLRSDWLGENCTILCRREIESPPDSGPPRRSKRHGVMLDRMIGPHWQPANILPATMYDSSGPETEWTESPNGLPTSLLTMPSIHPAAYGNTFSPDTRTD